MSSMVLRGLTLPWERASVVYVSSKVQQCPNVVMVFPYVNAKGIQSEGRFDQNHQYALYPCNSNY